MSITDQSIAPADGLVTPADPGSGQKSQFALFSDSWLQLQGFVGSALELPMSKGDFETKYGSYGQMTKITGCVDAMRSVKETSKEFGDPKSLRAQLIKNPNLLATDTVPPEIYTHTVWLGARVKNSAQQLVQGYEYIQNNNANLPTDRQVKNLKEYLFDKQMGPIAISEKMSKEAGDLIIKLGKFEKKMNDYNAKMKEFTKDGSAMITEVDTAIGALTEKIKGLEKSRDDAYKAWRDFTIAAVTASIGVAIIGACLAPFTFGTSVAIGAAAGIAVGVGLGVKAAQQRAKYNEYCKQIETENEEKRKKQRLRADLGDFNNAMKNVGPAMASFLKNLQTVQGVWVGMNNDMVNIGKNVSEANIGDSAFMVKMKSQAAINSWKDIQAAAEQFSTKSLIDYTSIAFGDEMPEKSPAAA